MPKRKTAPKKKVTRKVTKRTSSKPTQTTYTAPVFTSAYLSSEQMKHNLITCLLLVFAYPLGLLVMFTWTKWPMPLKVLLAIPMAFFFIFVILPVAVIFLIGAHEYKQMKKINTTPVVTQAPAPTSTPTLAPTGKKMTY